MRSLTICIQAAVEPASAFGFIVNPANEVKWNPAAVRVEQLSPPPIAVGSRFTVVGRMLGRERAVELAVTEVDAPRQTRTLSVTGPMRFDTTYVVEPAGIGASVTMSVSVTVEGTLRLAGPVLRAGFGRRLSRLSPRLKEAIEAYAAAEPGAS